MRRTDVERIKQFASRTEDRARPAYGRIRVDMKRRGIFIATTNERRTSKARRATGVSGRFGRGDRLEVARDRDQLWAEAAHLEASGASIILAEKFRPVAEEIQTDRMDGDEWMESVIAAVKDKD